MSDTQQMPDRIEINVEELTLGDIDDLTTKHGENWLEEVQKKSATAIVPILIDLVHLLLKHDFPDATVEDARRMKILSLTTGAEEDKGKGPKASKKDGVKD